MEIWINVGDWFDKCSYREIEDEDVCSIPHFLVENHHKNDQEVANEANDDDESEDDGDHNWHHGHQDLQVNITDIIGQLGIVGNYWIIHDDLEVSL